MRRRTTLLLGATMMLAFGCRGPLTAPAIRRLEPDAQAQVDRMWNNMLVKPKRLDRELLLDVILAFELHEAGVDQATFHSEKDFAGGVVLMDMKYDRRRPLEDWFFIEMRDRENKSIRKEHYCGDEIWSHYKDVAGIWLVAAAATQPATEPVAATRQGTYPTEVQLHEQWRMACYSQLMAATQPVPPAP